MYRVRIFAGSTGRELETKLNEWLKIVDDAIELVDIKYAYSIISSDESHTSRDSTALIIYKNISE